MDTRATGVNGGSGNEKAAALQQDIDRLRSDLATTVGELDRRRHDLLDVRAQLRRHPLPIALVAVALLAVAAGGIALGVMQQRRKQRLGARLERLQRALGRMVAKPNRVATDQGVGRKIVAAAGAAAASLTAKKLVAKAFRGQAKESPAT